MIPISWWTMSVDVKSHIPNQVGHPCYNGPFRCNIRFVTFRNLYHKVIVQKSWR